MAKRFDKMTVREKFVRLMIRGWKEKKKQWSNKHGYHNGDMTKFCAFGVVGHELGLPSMDMYAGGVRRAFGESCLSKTELPYHTITHASDGATSKADAIRRVKKALGV